MSVDSAKLFSLGSRQKATLQTGRFGSNIDEVERKIVGYHLDEEGEWVAELECLHGYHVRHIPPLVSRPWVLTPEGRAGKLGAELNCLRCDQLEWPEGLVSDRKSREFSEKDVLPGLLKAHATPSGVWAKIHVMKGRLLYRVEIGSGKEFLLAPKRPGVIAPEMLHCVRIVEPVTFFLEFFRPSR